MTVSPHVVVIGAGTVGMCTAFSLIEQGAADWVPHGAPVSVPCSQSLAPSAGRNTAPRSRPLTDVLLEQGQDDSVGVIASRCREELDI
ncbi:hypothetical protein SAMN03159463_02524 [Mesorhizobium sp. NFR06]|uniref:hypothetical protein n=1 Tax=Mesorhizobium sp. NFR06 TaxID=1566290 RepID=UPI0008F0C7B0|nr:hypothetical protein [Mesorhizobium sp. NFR06]SFO65453.1 hypothetical protein SAMN03159463_02524 [Mesorhizobium sp. NFR06]